MIVKPQNAIPEIKMDKKFNRTIIRKAVPFGTDESSGTSPTVTEPLIKAVDESGKLELAPSVTADINDDEIPEQPPDVLNKPVTLIKVDCQNKEVNRRYLDTYVVNLLRDKIFNPNAMKKNISRVNKYINSYTKEYNLNYESIKNKLGEVQSNLDNITKAIEKGIITDSIVARAEKLEQQKTEIEAELSEMHRYIPVKYEDFKPLIDEFKTLERGTEAFRTFIQRYVGKIVVYPYELEIELNTGLCVADCENEIVKIKRGELYGMFETSKGVRK